MLNNFNFVSEKQVNLKISFQFQLAIFMKEEYFFKHGPITEDELYVRALSEYQYICQLIYKIHPKAYSLWQVYKFTFKHVKSQRKCDKSILWIEKSNKNNREWVYSLFSQE